MLISALCDYYEILAKNGKVLPAGYSRVKVHNLVSLTPDGTIDEIIDWQKKEQVPAGKGKLKEKAVPREVIMPRRTEKTVIDANYIEHRPLYLFGLSLAEGKLTPADKTDKAKKSHAALVQTNLEFLEGLDSPAVNAYRAFLERWDPARETENPWLLGLGKSYGTAGFAFCPSGHPEQLLHEDEQVRAKWEKQMSEEKKEDGVTGQCAVTGERALIARIHNKIKGVPGGPTTGAVLVGFNNESEKSYGNDQAYNSNISEGAMKKYTEALNYLLSGNRHRAVLDDVTVLFWAMCGSEKPDDLFSALMFGSSEQMDEEQTEKMLFRLMQSAREGAVTARQIATTADIDPDVDFYLVGMKPNAARLALKFCHRRKYGDILENIGKHQNDIQIVEEGKPVPLWRIKREMVSPKSKNEAVDPALLSKIMESVLYGTNYPAALLSTMVWRVKTDKLANAVRVGVIKGCIQRKLRLSGREEEFKLALDRDNKNQAYLCGRLFAVLEKLQQDVSGGNLNRTIKDGYFASASAKPALVFPKLINLAQNHLKKTKHAAYYNILIGEITDGLAGAFPDTLLLTDQGRFIIGYYQQYQSFFTRKEDQKTEINEEEN